MIEIYSDKDNFNKFKIIATILLIVCILNIIYKINFSTAGLSIKENLWNPTWLLIGPLIYFSMMKIASETIPTRNYILHLIPFLCFTIYFLFTKTTVTSNNPWLSKHFIYYQNSFFLIPLSLLIYNIYCLKYCLVDQKTILPRIRTFIISNAILLSIASILLIMMYFAWGIAHIDTVIDYRFFVYTILFIVSLSIAKLLMYKQPNLDKTINIEENGEDDEMEILKEKILKYFGNGKIYLNPNLNLDTISHDLSIPKLKLTQLFNQHLKTNFYSFIAYHRIMYAVNLMEERNSLHTIESISQASGFNSKSSFNKYFKEVTGMAPSDYQLKLSKTKTS